MIETENKQLTSALYYLNKCNFSVIPAKNDKRPLIQWQEFQKQKPPESVVRKWWGEQYKFANIAIITGKVSNLTVLDVDTSEGKQKLHDLLPDTFVTPIVDTPGKGEHFYCQYQEGVTNAVRFMPGCDIRSEGGYVIAPPSADARGRWKWREGCKIGTVDFAQLPMSVLDYIYAFIKEGGAGGTFQNQALQSVTSVTKRYIDFTEGHRDDTIFHVTNCLVKGGMPQEEIEQFLYIIANKVCDPPFPQRDIPEKIKSALKRSENRERNLAQEISEWVSVTTGYISVTECDKELQIVTKEQKANRRLVFHRLSESKIIQRVESRPGVYRRVDADYQEIEIEAIDDQPGLDIELPLFLHQHVEIMPKDLIVFAGVTNSGKTAILLDAARLNQRKFKVFYFSSEMGKHALKKRWRKRDPYTKGNFKFIEGMNAENVLDWLKPDDVNIIDYLEDNEGEPFRVVSTLAKIQHRLKNGVAIIAMQKNEGVKWAVGGQQTKSKASVFCTIDPDYPGALMRIQKAKSFKGENPNGFECRFKIVNGINIVETTSWKPEMEK
jgi:hypothetical protein